MEEVLEKYPAIVSVEVSVVKQVLAQLHELLNDPLRSGHIRVKDFDVNESFNNEISHFMEYLHERTPIYGMDLQIWRNPSSSGKVWIVKESDVRGPVYHPKMYTKEQVCQIIRSNLLEQMTLHEVKKVAGVSRHYAQDHAYGRCDCEDVDIPPLEYTYKWKVKE